MRNTTLRQQFCPSVTPERGQTLLIDTRSFRLLKILSIRRSRVAEGAEIRLLVMGHGEVPDEKSEHDTKFWFRHGHKS